MILLAYSPIEECSNLHFEVKGRGHIELGQHFGFDDNLSSFQHTDFIHRGWLKEDTYTLCDQKVKVPHITLSTHGFWHDNWIIFNTYFKDPH